MPNFEIEPFEVPKSAWIAKEKRRDAIGEGFEVGLTIGTAYNFAKGYHSPYFSSYLGRVWTGLNYACANSVRTCGVIAGLYMVYEVLDNAVSYNLQKESPISTFVSSATVTAIATARRGPLFCSLSVIGFGGTVTLMHHTIMKWEAQAAKDKKRTN